MSEPCEHDGGDVFNFDDDAGRLPPQDAPASRIAWATCNICGAFDPLSIEAYRRLGGVETFDEEEP